MKQCLAVLIGISLLLCGCGESKQPSADTIAVLELSQDEKRIAQLMDGIFEKYELPIGQVYDIRLDLYIDGDRQEQGGIIGIDLSEEGDNVLLLCGLNTKGIDYQWKAACDGTLVTFGAVEIDDGKSYTRIYGPPSSFEVMEKGKEYLLYGVACQEIVSESTTTRTAIFEEWSDEKQRAENMQEFDYVYAVTISLSEQEPYKS